jgi:hypothetical protein
MRCVAGPVERGETTMMRMASPCACTGSAPELHGFLDGDGTRWAMYLAACRSKAADRWIDLALSVPEAGTAALRVWCIGGVVRALVLNAGEVVDHPARVFGAWMSARRVGVELPDVVEVVREILARDERLRDHLRGRRSAGGSR